MVGSLKRAGVTCGSKTYTGLAFPRLAFPLLASFMLSLPTTIQLPAPMPLEVLLLLPLAASCGASALLGVDWFGIAAVVVLSDTCPGMASVWCARMMGFFLVAV
ncbi:uncharacterized protein LY79DRAFT_570503 [Colletotrichum navitas]|uniref:Uncharacterized protein n=1 Tax=Colletotrichum navitas TaxID=681940 RepID=A0AAD8PLU5_9PEZI|nr:uncharacterized protein LY79DRAFT_570503 [Colletotrichum navitas]KAK1570088.1 hypothetical protein LY79DRAFT_570503 [Colletotrichum navitas]